MIPMHVSFICTSCCYWGVCEIESDLLDHFYFETTAVVWFPKPRSKTALCHLIAEAIFLKTI
ncbi:hypothetical protein KL86DES1_10442 [uncultured Desulfovibrio sp.]|uniref:Uncharacterized protein n=1 Tax=uncultured Desulfovibrio sp. TaxID=167968 RepID=A0A212KYV8_9BACT|nr:hypothetical protein KL86DES1_10442 [uncultured Desulfovibrio sp.]VZH32316.1 conserved protein of unknown function [Desulfovibrio sp. 86]